MEQQRCMQPHCLQLLLLCYITLIQLRKSQIEEVYLVFQLFPFQQGKPVDIAYILCVGSCIRLRNACRSSSPLQLCPIEKSTHCSGTLLAQHAIGLRRICWRVAMSNQIRDSHISTQHVGIEEFSHALVTPIRVIR